MPQITTLHLPAINEPRWDQLFPSHPTTTLPLTHFTCENPLDGPLLDKLLAHAPKLTHLCVPDVRVEPMAYKDKVWGLQELQLSALPADGAGLRFIASLPRRREGRTSLSGQFTLTFHIWNEEVSECACMV